MGSTKGGEGGWGRKWMAVDVYLPFIGRWYVAGHSFVAVIPSGHSLGSIEFPEVHSHLHFFPVADWPMKEHPMSELCMALTTTKTIYSWSIMTWGTQGTHSRSCESQLSTRTSTPSFYEHPSVFKGGARNIIQTCATPALSKEAELVADGEWCRAIIPAK